MLTIKNVSRTVPDDRLSEQTRIWEASNTFCENRRVEIDGEVEFVPTVSFEMPDGVLCSIDTGIVYVMNAAGKTVEVIRLKNSHYF